MNKKEFKFKGFSYSELVDKWELKSDISEEEYEKLEDNLGKDYKKYPIIKTSYDYNAFLLSKEISRLMDICVGLDWKDNRPSVEEVDNYNSRMKDIKDFLQALYDEKHSGYYKIMYKAIKMTGNNSEYAMLQLFDCFLHHLWT